MLIILFGLPGSGKAFVGKTMQAVNGYYFYDGDNDVPDKMRKALANKEKVTINMREEFFERLFESIQQQIATHTNVVVAQTFIKEKYRKQALQHFPKAQFILIKALPKVRAERLAKQNTMILLEASYAKKMDRRFDKPQIPHLTIINNHEGDAEIRTQLEKLKRLLYRSV